jgi:GntR family transcriptional regulator, transcriptional repressor for pyruvate dehydrogenase complex
MTRTDQVVDSLRGMILSGTLRPGDRLPAEKDLAASLDVSRGSLREGVRALTAMGVLDVKQGDGTFISSLEPELLLGPLSFLLDLHGDHRADEFLVVRRLLEAEAAASCARRGEPEALLDAGDLVEQAENLLDSDPTSPRLADLDDAFHQALIEASGNSVLVAMTSVITARVTPSGGVAERWVRRAVEEHRGVLNAVVSRDPERARLQMAAHLLALGEEQSRRL